jgi:glycosyltransferase involved in cell wall biosynthesis
VTAPRAGTPAGDGRVRLAYVTTIPLTQWTFLRGQNHFMAERGFELHAITSPGPDLERLAGRDPVVTHPVSISRGSISPVRDLLSLLRLVAVLRRVRPHILHVSTPKAALLGSVAGWLTRVPVRMFVFRGSATEGATGLPRRLFRALERLTVRLCHQTICVAPSLRAFARSAGILRPGEGVVLASGMSNGIDLARFDPHCRTRDSAEHTLAGVIPAGWLEGDGRVVGYLGRVTFDKGVEELAAAWRIVREAFPTARLLVVGPWEECSSVDTAARAALEHDPRVAITGPVEDTAACYRLMDLFVYPSHGTEGFPNAPVEAAAMELPVVATRVVGSVDAVVNSETGTLVEPHDVRQLADAVARYLRDPALCREHGRRGRARVEAYFRREVIWEALLGEYCRLLGERGLSLPSGRGPAGGIRERERTPTA